MNRLKAHRSVYDQKTFFGNCLLPKYTMNAYFSHRSYHFVDGQTFGIP